MAGALEAVRGDARAAMLRKLSFKIEFALCL